MPIRPPSEESLAQPPLELMELFGRMRSLTDAQGFSGTLPAIWQCSDESQMIKKSLFGYVYDCPVFNLGRVGALLDPTRLVPAAHHGHDLVILGGSHLGAREEQGIGYVERIHGEVAPCCGMLCRVLNEYLQIYLRAATLITLVRHEGEVLVVIPYKYLFRKPPGEVARIEIALEQLVCGEALHDSSYGKLYRLAPAFAARHAATLASVAGERRPIGALLDRGTFTFSKNLDPNSLDPRKMLEWSIFDFWPDIVTSALPHRRLADVNTWRQFHRVVSYLTDSFDSGARNMLVVAGLTIDHSIKRNTFVPQFAWIMAQGKALQARYFGPSETSELLAAQPIFRPRQTFLDYAGVARPD
jgi:hypothetical protein